MVGALGARVLDDDGAELARLGIAELFGAMPRVAADARWTGGIWFGDVVEIGITDYAQGELGDVVYVELPEVGQTVTAGQPFGSIVGRDFRVDVI